MSATLAVEWTPGDPLHAPEVYGGFLYDFKEDPETDECHCPDAARWPDPRPGQEVGERDDIRGPRC